MSFAIVDISLIICTRNRVEQLKKTLLSVSNIESHCVWEVVIVDNGSTDNTSSYLEDWKSDSKLNIKIVKEETPGLARARNSGWRSADGEIIAFTDDDCYPEKDYIDRVNECFNEYEIEYLGGRILLFDPSDYPITIKELNQHIDFNTNIFIPAGSIHGANMCFKKSALLRINGFNPKLGAGTPFPCEDIEIVARLSASGARGAYDPRPVVYHHHQRKTKKQAEELMKAYDKGRGAYYIICIMNPKLRIKYLYNWLRLLVKRPRKFIRELNGAFQYLVYLNRR